ncbi:hypothetical protein [Arcticibacter eurypsychrophilus]|uniref:hypothetical protein n=1 Tax=Arcticibacter eurypsychrophilus TaxID=1434752 RepID=UPI00084D46E5|nr:hypothetical protein [Arcticibacter eurypsychrophilus]
MKHIENFHLGNMEIIANTSGSLSYANGWTFDRVNFKPTDQSVLEIKNSQKMQEIKYSGS